MSVLNRMKNDLQLKKSVILASALVLALLILFAFFYIYGWGQRQEFAFSGDAFELVKISPKKMTLRDKQGEILVYTKDEWIERVIQYKGSTIRYGGGYGGLTGAGYTFSDGTRSEAYPAVDFTSAQQRDIRLISALNDYYNSVSMKYKHPFYYTIILIVIIAIVFIATYMIFYPEETWERNTFRRLFVDGGEPTDFALFVIKSIGIIAIIASFVVFLSIIVK